MKNYWDKLTSIIPEYGYAPKFIKSYLIVKESKLVETQNLSTNSSRKITTEGKTHLGGFIESIEYCNEYTID